MLVREVMRMQHPALLLGTMNATEMVLISSCHWPWHWYGTVVTAHGLASGVAEGLQSESRVPVLTYGGIHSYKKLYSCNSRQPLHTLQVLNLSPA